MVAKKHKSKRIAASQRYKIAKNVREHHRKSRKEERQQPKHKAAPKDPGIPTMMPFRDEVLQEVAATRQRIQTDRLEAQKARRSQQINQARDLGALVRDAEEREQTFASTMRDASEWQARPQVDLTAVGKRDNSRKAYYKEFKKVVANADVILEVLDARDPMGCRVRQIEEMIRASGGRKRVVLLLNKIDLVPREVVEQWLKYLRHDYPTIAFKASTQQQRDNLGHVLHSAPHASTDRALTGSECLGGDQLMKLLKNYCRNANIKTAITVGVIGYPNVGKSSVINSLKRSRVCGVGNTPGFTKSLQEISLDKNIKLLDCPGIVFSAGDSAESAVEAVLRNCVKVELLEDPAAPVELILSRCSQQQMMKLYKIPAYTDTADFLVQVARQRGRLRRGGIPDTNSAAKSILQDWNSGKIPYYTLPPASTAAHLAAEIVPEWSTEFSVDDLQQADTAMLTQLKGRGDLSTEFMTMTPGHADVDMDAVPDLSDSECTMDVVVQEDEPIPRLSMKPELVTVSSANFKQTPTSRPRAAKSSVTTDATTTTATKMAVVGAVKKQSSVPDAEQALNPQRNKQLKKLAKKEQLKKKRMLANTAESGDVDAYDFGSDFAAGDADGDDAMADA